MSSVLTNAILSMDSYNRGYGAAVLLSGNQIGNYQISGNSSSLGQAIFNGQLVDRDEIIGFHATSYSYNGATIISFRGTDQMSLIPNPYTDLDVAHGWSLGAGNIASEQGKMAIEYYQHVAGANANLQTANIALTGHSLGGGLAGYIGAIYGKSASIYDSMDYTQAALKVWQYATTSDPLLADTKQQIIEDVYAGNNPWLLNSTGVDAYHLEGEALDSDFIRYVPSQAYAIGSDVTLNPVDRHSASTLVMAIYAQDLTNQSWNYAAKHMWPVLYNDGFAQSIGMNDARVDGVSQNIGEYSDILRTILAYSAIDEGERPFGDTAIRALYDDANDLGAVLNSPYTSKNLVDAADDISKAFVQYAGQLA
ncbi:MAG: hypothetical protein DI626_10535, partial [Micavibrio aeruginosavorus]